MRISDWSSDVCSSDLSSEPSHVGWPGAICNRLGDCRPRDAAYMKFRSNRDFLVRQGPEMVDRSACDAALASALRGVSRQSVKGNFRLHGKPPWLPAP